jgi:TonB family protein
MSAAMSLPMPGAMAAPGGISFKTRVLPWAATAEDERRFKRIAQAVVLATLVLGLVVPWLKVTLPERTQPAPLPAPMARLLIEEKPKPAAPPPKVAEANKPKPDPAAPEAQAAAPKPAPKIEKPVLDKAPVPEARNPVAGKPPGEDLASARKRASGVGLLAMKDEIATMTGAPMAVQLKQDIKPGPGVGTNTGVGVGMGTEAGLPVRALITSNATNGSGGINTAAYSKDTGGGGLAGRATTLVEGVAGGGGGGGPGGGGSRSGPGGTGTGATAGLGGKGAGGVLTKGANGSGKASRSLEDIKLVFERNKGAIYALYNRALRDEPSLQGKVVLELKIAPAGNVESLRIVSSELKAAELEAKLLARIRQFDFGAKDVEVMVVTWPVDFLPS